MAAAGTQTAIGVNGLFLRGFSGSASPAMPSVAPGRPGSTRRGSCWHVPILGGKEGPRRAEALSSLAPRPKISASEPLTSPGPTLDPGQCDYWWAAAAAHPRRLASSFSSGPLSFCNQIHARAQQNSTTCGNSCAATSLYRQVRSKNWAVSAGAVLRASRLAHLCDAA